MRVFVTGASGYIGKAVALAFRRAGHTVFGLVRTENSKKMLIQGEVIPVIGDLNHPNDFRNIIEESEVIVDCAHESSPNSVARDAAKIELFLNAAHKNKLPHTLIYTSGVWVYGNTGNIIADEASILNPIDIVTWRPAHEEMVLNGSSDYVKTVVIRPGCVYGGVGGLTKIWFDSTLEGAVTMVGDGANRWTMIHVDDLANLYVLAAEKEVNRVVLNATGESNHNIKDIVEKIAQIAGLDGKIRQLTLEEAVQKMGRFATGLTIDQRVSSQRATHLLGWLPKHASFMQEIERYYEAWKQLQ